MGHMKCYDHVIEVINDAIEQYGSAFELRVEKEKWLWHLCEELDKLIEEFECEAFEVEIDDIKMRLTLSIECSDIILESREHSFFDFVLKLSSFKFSKADEDVLRTEFFIDNLWG